MKIRTFKNAWPHIDDSAYVDPLASVIGNVVIGPDASVWPMAVIRGDVNHIRIGARSNVQDGSIVHVTHPYAARPEGNAVTIGDDVTIGHRAAIHGCTIGNECLIGIGAIILDGAVLQDRVLLGAGSLVKEDKVLESGYLYVGSPARQVRRLNDEELKWFKYSAQHYVQLKNDHLVSL